MVGYEPDLNPYIDWEEEFRKLRDNDYPPVTKIDMVSKPVLKIPEPCNVQDAYYEHRLATPLVQVFSVYILTDFDESKSCEIYGSIQALEGSGCVFNLYDRDPQDSETISKDDALSLIGPDGGAIIPSKTTKLDLCLSDRVQGVEVVKGCLNLVPVAEESYDKLLKGVVEGAHGVAYVYYAVFRFALYSTIQVIVTKNDNDNVSDVYGSIVAGYGNGRVYCNADDEVTCLETRLLDMPSHRPLHVVVGEPTSIKLPRNVVVVPAYSSLTIQLNLWDSRGKITSDSLQFPAHILREDPLYIRTQIACIEVRVNWHHAYYRLYNYKRRVPPCRAESSKTGELQKVTRVSGNQNCSALVDPRNIPDGHYKVEVFTVFVGGITEKLSALCGTIIIDDGSDRFSIYKRDETNFQLLQDDGLACIEFNYRSIQNCEFGICLKLKDPVRKLEVSRGELGWNVGSVESSMLWYGKRVCSVVRGKDGYAAVHYEIFDRAVEAFVEVRLVANNDVDATLHLYGSLNGRYSSREYSTSYEKKYYSSRLFECPRNTPLEQKTGSKLPLLKSIVVVPVRSSLLIEASLSVLRGEKVDAEICGITEFCIDFYNTKPKTIQGNGYSIELSAKFTAFTL